MKQKVELYLLAIIQTNKKIHKDFEWNFKDLRKIGKKNFLFQCKNDPKHKVS